MNITRGDLLSSFKYIILLLEIRGFGISMFLKICLNKTESLFLRWYVPNVIITTLKCKRQKGVCLHAWKPSLPRVKWRSFK